MKSFVIVSEPRQWAVGFMEVFVMGLLGAGLLREEDADTMEDGAEGRV